MDTTLTPTEQETLVSLSRTYGDGDNIQANIADEIDRSTRSVGRALDSLVEQGLVESKGRGVYRLTPDGEQVAERLSGI